MHPELISSLATERRRDMIATANAYRLAPHRPARRRVPHLTVPMLRVTWSRTTLAAAAGRRRGRSYVIVISATRTL